LPLVAVIWKECERRVQETYLSQISSVRANSMKYSPSGNNNFTFSDFKADQKFMFLLLPRLDKRTTELFEESIVKSIEREKEIEQTHRVGVHTVTACIVTSATRSPTVQQPDHAFAQLSRWRLGHETGKPF